MPAGDRPVYPFQATPEDLEKRLDEFVLATTATLSSFYMELPRGENFLEYEPFKNAYDALRTARTSSKTSTGILSTKR